MGGWTVQMKLEAERFEGFEAERFSFSFSVHKIGRWQKERSLKLEMISSTVMANWQ